MEAGREVRDIPLAFLGRDGAEGGVIAGVGWGPCARQEGLAVDLDVVVVGRRLAIGGSRRCARPRRGTRRL